SDGRIVAVGAADFASTTDPGFVAVRLNGDGSLDGTFGTGGIAKVDLGVGSGFKTAHSGAIQSDGRMVMAGIRYDDGGGGSVKSTIKVVRLLGGGSVDPSFGTGGIVSLALPGWAEANDVVVQGDGKIVVGGYEYVPYFSGTEQAYLLARLDTGGALDATFGTGGIVDRKSTRLNSSH